MLGGYREYRKLARLLAKEGLEIEFLRSSSTGGKDITAKVYGECGNNTYFEATWKLKEDRISSSVKQFELTDLEIEYDY